MNHTKSKRWSRLWSLALIPWLIWLLTACGPDEAQRALRPLATSTPSSGRPSGYAALSPDALSAPDASAPLSDPAVEQLATEAMLANVTVPVRDLRDLALRLNPEVTEIPQIVNQQVPEYAVGDRQVFQAHDVDANRNFTVTAQLRYISDVAYVWVEEEEPHDLDAIADAVERFSTEIYPDAVEFFGSEWNPGVDNDPRLHILHVNGLGSTIAGYYSSADQYSRRANEFSNEREMFYVNLSWLNAARDYEYYETLLAHEFQHMVHWHNDRNEETWVNEGLSEFAQDVAGYEPDTVFARTFAARPDTQLNTWGEINTGNAEHYGSSYLFMNYFTQRFGPEMTRALVAHPANGIAAFNAVLESAGTGESFNSVFADWVIANYVDDPNALGLDGRYGYHTLAQTAPVVAQAYDRYPAQVKAATVSNYGTDYYRLEGEGDLEVEFQGQAVNTLAAVPPYRGRYMWWSNRGDDSDSRLTRRFDLRGVDAGVPLELNVAMWWDIEDDYDYGYVLASEDGRKWDILAGQRSRQENPTGNSFGPAYTGTSEEISENNGWVVERFDLSPYLGRQVWLRFEYVTDDAVNASGWFVADVHIPAIDYRSQFEQGNDGWISEGWLRTDNRLRQDWIVQLLTFDENLLQGVEQIEVAADGHAHLTLPPLGGGKTAALAISAVAPSTTEPAAYDLTIRPVTP